MILLLSTCVFPLSILVSLFHLIYERVRTFSQALASVSFAPADKDVRLQLRMGSGRCESLLGQRDLPDTAELVYTAHLACVLPYEQMAVGMDPFAVIQSYLDENVGSLLP